MQKKDLEFLTALVEAPSPSGFEQPAAKVFREFVSKHADHVETNVMGSVYAVLKGTGKGKAAGPSVMLAGHIDEVGMMVNYITPEGFIAFKAIGGVDAAILPGMRVRVHTKDGALLGVMGRKPIHLIEDDERKNVTKLEKLFIPAQRMDIEQHRARSIREVSDMRFAVGQLPDQPRVDGSAEQITLLGRLAGAVNMVQNPADLGISPLPRAYSPRSSVSTGHTWPVPFPLGAQGCPSAAPSPYPSPLYRCQPGPLGVSVLIVASTTGSDSVMAASLAGLSPSLTSSRNPASITVR